MFICNFIAVDEQPRRKQRGIKRKILNAPRGGELILYPPQEDSSAAGGLKKPFRYSIVFSTTTYTTLPYFETYF